MIKTKTLHIISNVLVAVFFLLYLWMSIAIFDFVGYDLIIIFPILLALFFFVWSAYFINSYRKTNLENKYFRISAIIVILYSIIYSSFFISFFDIIYSYFNLNADTIDMLFNILLGILSIVAFIIFLVGYYKNKK